MKRYTVVWSPAALRRLAELWVDNAAVRQEVSDATDEIEAALGERPASVGLPLTDIARLVVRPPVAILFRIVEPDRQVRVIHIKFWDE